MWNSYKLTFFRFLYKNSTIVKNHNLAQTQVFSTSCEYVKCQSTGMDMYAYQHYRVLLYLMVLNNICERINYTIQHIFSFQATKMFIRSKSSF